LAAFGPTQGGTRAGIAAESGGISVASGLGESAPASIVRIIQPGESVADIINEGKALTFTTGNEYAVVTLANGDRETGTDHVYLRWGG
jgi:hypothetical protein